MQTDFAQSTALAIKVNIINEETRLHALALCTDAKGLKVSDVEGFKFAGEVLNSLGRTRVFLEKTVKEARQPFVEQANKYSEEGKPLINAVIGAEAALNTEMRAFDRMQQEEKRKAEQERQRLAEEARKAQEAAAKAIETAQTNEAFDQAETQFKKGLEIAEQAKEVIVPQTYKPTGAKSHKVAVIESVDLSKLPIIYHMADEGKIKKAILAGIIDQDTPGVKWRIDETFIGSGR